MGYQDRDYAHKVCETSDVGHDTELEIPAVKDISWVWILVWFRPTSDWGGAFIAAVFILGIVILIYWLCGII